MKRISLLLFTAILLLNAPAVYGATTAELQAQIALLLQQVQALQAQLQASPTSTVLTFTLRPGSTDVSSGGEVTKLQEFLARDKNIYPEALVTGYFGVLTEAAVKRFQAQNGIAAIGVVGPQTREAIKRVSAPPAVTSVTITTTPAPAATSTPPTPVSPPATPSLGTITLSPSSAGVGEAVTITGSGFTATGNDIYFGAGVIGNLSSFNGGTMITLQIPNEASSTRIFPGTYNVWVSNANGKSATTTFTVTSGTNYPSIVSVSPSVAKVGDTITITGSGFDLTDNEVHLGVGGTRVGTLRKVRGTLLDLTVPSTINDCDFPTGSSPCTGKSYSIVPGNYALYIVNASGKSNSVTLTVTAY